MVWTFWNKYRNMENFLDKLKRYKYECQTRTTVSIRYRSYKGYRAVPSLESYTSSPLEIRLELQLDIGSTTDIRSRTTDVWILRHHRIAIHKDCLTDRNSTITGLIYRKTISRSDTHGQWYIWIICEIFLDHVFETSHYWTLINYTGH